MAKKASRRKTEAQRAHSRVRKAEARAARKHSGERRTGGARGAGSEVRIDGPVALLAELPGLLRFTPESPSITILGRRRGSENHGSPVMRVDLPEECILDAAVAGVYYDALPSQAGRAWQEDDAAGDDPRAHSVIDALDIEPAVRERAAELGVRTGDIDALDELLRPIVSYLASTLLPLARDHDLDQVVAVVLLADSCTPGTLGWAAVDSFARVLRVGFDSVDTVLHSCLLAEEIGEGAAWREAGSGGAAGVQGDPRQGRIAAESVAAGTQIFRRRADIESLYAEEAGVERLPRERASAAARGWAEASGGAEGREPTDEDLLAGARRLAELARGGDPAEGALAEAAELISASAMGRHLLAGIVASAPVGEDVDREDVDREDAGGEHSVAEGRTESESSSEAGCESWTVGGRDWAPFGVHPGDLALLVPLARRGRPACRGTALLVIGIGYYLRGVGVHALVCAEAAVETGHLAEVCRCMLLLLEQGAPPEVAADILRDVLDELLEDSGEHDNPGGAGRHGEERLSA